LLNIKYLHRKTFSQVQEKPNDCPFLKGLMGVKNVFSSVDLLLLGMAQEYDLGEIHG
jgi:hypothetical protein